jgi:hypothetical protein
LQVASYYQGSTSMMRMSMWYVILVPFFIMTVVLGDRGRRNTHDSKEETEVDSTCHGEEEEMEGYDENENDSGTRQFTCHHCYTTYTCSYTHMRKHLCGLMHCDEGKTIGVKNLCGSATERKH